MRHDGNRKRSPRGALKVLCVLLGTVLVLMLGLTVRAASLLGSINYVDPATAPTLSQGELDRLELAVTVPGEASEPEKRLSADALALSGDDGVINILLIGQDRREGQSRARSDAMILCTFHPERGRLTLTSFLRDLWVRIPGYRDNKLNAAYAAGGMKLLDETLEQNFGITIDASVEVDFSRFSRIIDLLGGVELTLRSDEAAHINKCLGGSLKAGVNSLTGEQALCYCRIRKLDPDADFSRTARQRKVLDGLIRKYQDTSMTRVLGILEELLPMVTTDMTRRQIVSYATMLFPMLSDMELVSQRIPADGTYTTPVIRGMSVVLADMDAARALLRRTMAGEA